MSFTPRNQKHSNQCTVTLSKVRSYGTEDRVTDRPLAPLDKVYEQVTCRGSDIKDLIVHELPLDTHLQDQAMDCIVTQSGRVENATTFGVATIVTFFGMSVIYMPSLSSELSKVRFTIRQTLLGVKVAPKS
jgi:hypothetical protein